MPTTIDHIALESHLPHRGCNLIPDEVVVQDGGTVARSSVSVQPGDARGRGLMARRDGAGRTCWSEPFIFEFLALTGIPLLTPRLAPAGQVAVFSSISRLVFHRLPAQAARLIGHAEITRDRAAEVSGRPPRPLPLPPSEPIADFAWKSRAIRFVDGVAAWDAPARRIVCTYTYPHDHPFVPGHFPGAPLMMGVTQLAAVGDAAWVALTRLGLSAGTVSGSVRRPDGSEVAEVRELALADDGGTPRVASLRRIAFREPVRPDDTLLIEATVA
jgi:3-hydroxymyristoyl/3-hydroxydecanoyl-(acyl carrier protein) dehydratase